MTPDPCDNNNGTYDPCKEFADERDEQGALDVGEAAARTDHREGKVEGTDEFEDERDGETDSGDQAQLFAQREQDQQSLTGETGGQESLFSNDDDMPTDDAGNYDPCVDCGSSDVSDEDGDTDDWESAVDYLREHYGDDYQDRIEFGSDVRKFASENDLPSPGAFGDEGVTQPLLRYQDVPPADAYNQIESRAGESDAQDVRDGIIAFAEAGAARGDDGEQSDEQGGDQDNDQDDWVEVRSPHRPLPLSAKNRLRDEFDSLEWLDGDDDGRNDGALVPDRPPESLLDDYELDVIREPTVVYETASGDAEIYTDPDRVMIGATETTLSPVEAVEQAESEDRFERIKGDPDSVLEDVDGQDNDRDQDDNQDGGEVVVGQRTLDVPAPGEGWHSVEFITNTSIDADYPESKGTDAVYLCSCDEVHHTLVISGTVSSNKWSMEAYRHLEPLDTDGDYAELRYGPGGYDSESEEWRITHGNTASPEGQELLREKYPTLDEVKSHFDDAADDNVEDDDKDGLYAVVSSDGGAAEYIGGFGSDKAAAEAHAREMGDGYEVQFDPGDGQDDSSGIYNPLEDVEEWGPTSDRPVSDVVEDLDSPREEQIREEQDIHISPGGRYLADESDNPDLEEEAKQAGLDPESVYGDQDDGEQTDSDWPDRLGQYERDRTHEGKAEYRLEYPDYGGITDDTLTIWKDSSGYLVEEGNRHTEKESAIEQAKKRAEERAERLLDGQTGDQDGGEQGVLETDVEDGSNEGKVELEFGSRGAANTARDWLPDGSQTDEYDRRNKTVEVYEGALDEGQLDRLTGEAADSKSHEASKHGQIELTDDERDSLEDRSTWDGQQIFHARSAKGILRGHGIDDWLSWYDPQISTDEHREIAKRAQQEQSGGKRMDADEMDDAQVDQKISEATNTAKSEVCDSAEKWCIDKGDDDACETLVDECAYTRAEIEKMQEQSFEDWAAEHAPDAERPSDDELARLAPTESDQAEAVDELPGEAYAALSKAWGGYKAARADVREAQDEAEEYAEVINGIRTVNGQDPLEFEQLDGWAGGEVMPDEPDETYPTDDGQVTLSDAAKEGDLTAEVQGRISEWVSGAKECDPYDPCEDLGES